MQFRKFNKQKITNLKLEGPYHDNTLTNIDKNNCDIITTEAMSLNPAHCEIYSIQYYVVHFVSDLRQVGRFIRVLRFSFTNKIDRHDITEILLKVVWNTLTLTMPRVRSMRWICEMNNKLGRSIENVDNIFGEIFT